MLEEISLYFHIPFCKRKCDYCHFYVLPEQEKSKDNLLEGFSQELTLLSRHLKNKQVVSLYFGGGTPSLFAPSRIASLIEQAHAHCHILPSAEITLEANPENITEASMQDYASAGINRVSIGIQTLDNELLNLLGRQHHSETALHAIHTTYQAGIKNISIDLMYDLPKQTLHHWSATLKQVKALPIAHLSLYNLTIEPHTLFFKNQKQLRPWLPDEEASLAMYEMAQAQLSEMGLDQYEISAFARPGYESRHNTGYWTGRPFLGLGPSAFSYWEGKRYRNVAHLERYLHALKGGNSPVDFEEQLDPEARRRELFVIHLRLFKGVSIKEFTQKHGALDQKMENALSKLVGENYLYWQNDRLHLTQQGILFYDSVAAELI